MSVAVFNGMLVSVFTTVREKKLVILFEFVIFLACLGNAYEVAFVVRVISLSG